MMMSTEGNILVIDDEEIVRMQVREIFEAAGYSVFEGANGEEGREVFREHQDQIALVLLDLRMPDMSGYETLAEMQIIDPDVKIIVITGYTPDEERLPGIKRILRKPLVLDMLLRVAREVLEE